ncbi:MULTISPECIES: fluoride efflux transporter CrcB [Streptococcus]|uniref:fluoride efflux transporter CrcB n=1 Tax=Streptococcus TaxID=1301 RepID=UPI0007851FEA|nr:MULTISPECIES: fluoride efflux transporter CrcB [Streptococcus]KXT67278.1 CrcB protein [Streptococcus sp. DD04]MCY7217094.1 fluoride efflux transporter CrcB [Streptococcus cristatus]
MKEIKNSLAIFLAAMLGGWLRYQASLLITFTGHFPLATLLVNYLGTVLLIYLIKGYLTSKQVTKRLLLALSTGFCGGLTTFSGLLLDSLKLLGLGHYLELLLYLALSIGGSLCIALWAGRKVAA